jgi:hypothetical protein
MGKSTRPDVDLNCKTCGVQPHRFQPSTEAGPYWRCSVCGEPTPGPEDAVDRVTRCPGCPTCLGVEDDGPDEDELHMRADDPATGSPTPTPTPTPTPIDMLHGAAVCSLGLLLHGNERTDRQAAAKAVADGIDALASAGADLLRYLEVSNRAVIDKDAELVRLRKGAAEERARWEAAHAVEHEKTLGAAGGAPIREALDRASAAARLEGDDPHVCPGCMAEAERMCAAGCPDHRPVSHRERRSALAIEKAVV